MQLKARDGSGHRSDDPTAVQAALGSGRPLESGVRSRGESAFGQSFAHVRAHTDATASRLSSEQNARAFTVGEHVAFAAGEYRPGTIIGDALIAHELAHVVQQGGAGASVAPMHKESASYNALEADADQAAVRVVVSLWGGAKGTLADVAENARPRFRSGLQLSRCGATRAASRTPSAPMAPSPGTSPTAGAPAGTSGTPCPTSVRIGAIAQRNHSDLPADQKEQWRTFLSAMSRMDVDPGPDHTGHCMKERLTTISNNCPAAVYERGGGTTQPCTGNKCLKINQYGTMGGVSDGQTAFLDMHRTRNPSSLLEGTGVNSCTVVCEQVYTCDRTYLTTGVFRITRNYQAGDYTRPDGTQMHITTGTVTKTER